MLIVIYFDSNYSIYYIDITLSYDVNYYEHFFL